MTSTARLLWGSRTLAWGETLKMEGGGGCLDQTWGQARGLGLARERLPTVCFQNPHNAQYKEVIWGAKNGWATPCTVCRVAGVENVTFSPGRSPTGSSRF